MIEVKITPTNHSQRRGHDLSIRSEFANAAWCKSDLTREELEIIRDAIYDFLES
jgi:hypothetical protein